MGDVPNLRRFFADQKNWHFANKAGVEIPEGLGQHGEGKPLLAQYLPGKMRVLSGAQHLSFSKLRDGARSTQCSCSVCDSLLFVDNPSYEGLICAVFPEFCPIANNADVEPAFRVQVNDWPAAERVKLQPLPSYWKHPETGDYLDEDGKPDTGFKDMREAFLDTVKPVVAAAEGLTFAELLASAGGDDTIQVLGLPELPASSQLRHSAGKL